MTIQNPTPSSSSHAIGWLVRCFFVMAPTVALAQSAPVPSREASTPAAHESSTAKQTTPGSGDGADQDALADFRPPLLREGSRLVEARGRIRRDPSSGWWLLKVESDSPTAPAPAFELILLPGTLLSEMQHVAESTTNQQVVFDVTGEVFVYRGRNFVMPTHAPKLISHPSTQAMAPASQGSRASPPESVPATPAPSSRSEAPATSMPDPINPGDSAQDIMRHLEESIGPAPGHVAIRATGADGAEYRGSTRASPRPTGAGSTTKGESAGKASKLLQEGAAIISRRGQLTRDPSGGWRFVFDADATGLVDPPVRLLPCLLLEELENFARHNGSGAAILISGQVYLYGGRNFLLPTVFRVPRERTNITP